MEARKVVEIYAEMTCDGCSGAITRILQRIPGVADVSCSIEEQKVRFTANAEMNPNDALDKLKVWAEAAGKQVRLIE